MNKLSSIAKSYESLSDRLNEIISDVSVLLNLKNTSLFAEPDVVKVSNSNVQSLHVTYILTSSP
jgi:hypothetical protein